MSVNKPKFLENVTVQQSYYEKPSPYVTAPSSHVNLLRMSKYARECGKKLTELTTEEVKRFLIQEMKYNEKKKGRRIFVLLSMLQTKFFAEIAIDKDQFTGG